MLFRYVPATKLLTTLSVFAFWLHIPLLFGLLATAYLEQYGVRIGVLVAVSLLTLVLSWLLLVLTADAKGRSYSVLLALLLLHAGTVIGFMEHWRSETLRAEHADGRTMRLHSDDLRAGRLPAESDKHFYLSNIRFGTKDIEWQKSKEFRRRTRRRDTDDEYRYEFYSVNYRLVPIFAADEPTASAQPLAYACYNDYRQSLYPFDTAQAFYRYTQTEQSAAYAELAENYRIAYGWRKGAQAPILLEQADLALLLSAHQPSGWRSYFWFWLMLVAGTFVAHGRW